MMKLTHWNKKAASKIINQPVLRESVPRPLILAILVSLLVLSVLLRRELQVL